MLIKSRPTQKPVHSIYNGIAQGLNCILRYFGDLKNLYGRFYKNTEGFFEYYLKLDGYYYCNRKKSLVAVIRVRHKRTADIIPVQNIVMDKEYLKELHPLDVYILCIVANNERNGVLDPVSVGWNEMHRSKEHACLVKSDPLLEMVGKYTNMDGEDMIILRPRYLNKTIEFRAADLYKHYSLLYALDYQHAASLGYDTSEAFIRKNVSNEAV